MTIETDTISDNIMSELLEEYDYNRPQRGEFMDAEVLQIEHDRILLDLGAKTDAVVPVREMKNTDDEILEEISEGDMVPVYIMKPPTMMHKTTVSLQQGIEKQDWIRAEEMMESQEILELQITSYNKGGLLVEFGNLEGFLPASLMPTVARMPDRDIAEKTKANLIGEKVHLSVIEANPKTDRLIFSARENLKATKQKIYKDLKPDDVRNGIVVNLVDYGAFINLLGVDGLLHISEIGWGHLDHPSDVLDLGDKIEVKILDIDVENGRIGLSRKALINPIEAEELQTA